MNTQQDYILENDQVQLLPLEITHLESLLPFSLNEPELWHYSLTPANGIENLTNYINVALAARKEGTSYPFVVFDKTQNTIVGSTRFYDIQKHHETLQLGYTWYGKNHQGTGVNKNCKYLMLQFAFEALQMKRVEFRADAFNERSIAAMKSIGCTQEGILRNNCKSVTGRRDSIILSILQSEWEVSVKETLFQKL